ncbi:hypothetical protein [Roseimicrobium sp. ORNL1]|uniref:hypothetical protein n=1 Tax=Roseimicrobium sp. ORNL1 TaxID=2711231 RepID=UPI0013E15653|nr:hypothetical protein [Roseimicrobium sp. ORNL1]QIF01960.1 hypothetical protein G5S37_10605 [Roseimicrobium sp. ORNL1]
MSRRTKLVLLGIFLVLLAIPAVYFVLNWQPEKPLRFRLVSGADAGTGLPEGNRLVFEIENTSAVPVYLEGIRLVQGGDEANRHSRLGSFSSRMSSSNPTKIPAHGAVPLKGEVVYIQESRKVPMERFWIEYRWTSQPKFLVATPLKRLRLHLPTSIASQMPAVSASVDVTPLEVSGLTSQAPSSP